MVSEDEKDEGGVKGEEEEEEGEGEEEGVEVDSRGFDGDEDAVEWYRTRAKAGVIR